MASGGYPLDELGGDFEDVSDDGVDFPLPEGERLWGLGFRV